MASHDGPVGRDVPPSPGFFRSGKNAPQSDPTAKERRASRIGVPTKMFFRRNLSEGGPAFGRDWEAERRKIAAEDAGAAAGGAGGRGGLDGGDVAEGREGEGEDELGAGEMELRGAEEGAGSAPSAEGQQRAGSSGPRGAKKLLHKFGTGLKVVTPSGGSSGGGSSGESSSPRGQLLRRSFSSKGSGLGPAADKLSAVAASVSTGGVPPPVPDRPSRVLPPTPRMGSMLEKPVRNVEKATRGVGKLARSFSGNIDGHWGAIKREMGLAVRGKGRSSLSVNVAGPVASAPGGVDLAGAGGLGEVRTDGGGAERLWEASGQVGEGREILDGVMEHGAEVTVEYVDAIDALDAGMDVGLTGRDGGGGDAAVDMEGGEMAVDVVVCTTPGRREEGGSGSDEDVIMEGAEESWKKQEDDDKSGDVGKGSWEGETGDARLADESSLEPSDRAFSLSRLLSPRSGNPRSSSFSRGTDKNDVKSNVSAFSASGLSANVLSAAEPAGLHSEAARSGSGAAAGGGWEAPQAKASARVASEVEGSGQPKLLLEARSGRIAHVSRGLLRDLGYTSSEDFGGKSLYDLADGLYEADWSRAVEAVTKNNRASVRIHFKLLKSDRAGDLVGTRVALSLNVAGDEESVAGDRLSPAFLLGDLSPAPPQSSAPAAGAASGFRVRRVEVIIEERPQPPLQETTSIGTDIPGKYRDIRGLDCDSLGDRNGDSSRIDGESCDNSLESSSTSAEPHSTSPQEQITSPGSDWQAGSETNSDWSRESESQLQGYKDGIRGAGPQVSRAQRSGVVCAFGAPPGSITPPRALSRPPLPSRGNSDVGSASGRARSGRYHSARKPPVPRVSSTGSLKSVQPPNSSRTVHNSNWPRREEGEEEVEEEEDEEEEEEEGNGLEIDEEGLALALRVDPDDESALNEDAYNAYIGDGRDGESATVARQISDVRERLAARRSCHLARGGREMDADAISDEDEDEESWERVKQRWAAQQQRLQRREEQQVQQAVQAAWEREREREREREKERERERATRGGEEGKKRAFGKWVGGVWAGDGGEGTEGEGGGGREGVYRSERSGRSDSPGSRSLRMSLSMGRSQSPAALAASSYGQGNDEGKVRERDKEREKERKGPALSKAQAWDCRTRGLE
ncbi:unnamed protein product [Closterium sp. NIES-54]